MCMKACKAGDVLLRIPLRLAITDHAEDEESNRLVYSDAPWSVRLATKVLREAGKGRASPWFPYIRVLPSKVPCPLESFSWEDMQQVEWQPAQASIYEANWLVTDAYSRAAGNGPDTASVEAALKATGDGAVDWMVPETQRCGSPAPTNDQISAVLGGATSEAFQWAMAVVHSRTFANAARGGGVGVRMLVPLVDMINHGGDVTASGLMDDPALIATDNVRWDLVSPERAPPGWWTMEVSATRDMRPGDALVLSYGERSSDDFFVHYGFVPPLCNPHEDAVIFENAEDALEWHFEHYAADLGAMGQQMAEETYSRAYTAMQQEQKLAAWAERTASPSPGPPGSSGASSSNAGDSAGAGATSGTASQPSPSPSGSSGGIAAGVKSSMDAAFRDTAGSRSPSPSSSPPPPGSLNPGGAHNKSGAQLPRGWDKLKVYAGGRVDPALISGFSLAAFGDTRAAELAVARRVQQLLSGMPTPLLMDLWLLHMDAQQRGDGATADMTAKLLVQQAGLMRKHAAFVAGLGSDAASSAQGAGQDGAAALSTAADVGALPPTDNLTDLLTVLAKEASSRLGMLQAPLTHNQRLCVTYRASKKVLLWGFLSRVAAAEASQGPLTAEPQPPISKEDILRQVASQGWGSGSAGSRRAPVPRSLS